MKRLKYVYAGLSAVLLLATSCGKDYLSTNPTDAVDEKAAFATTASAYSVIQGIHKAMIDQYQTQNLNGEGTIKLFNEYMGDDFVGPQANGWFWANTQWTENRNSADGSRLSYFPYYYYYRIILNANKVIANIDGAEGAEADRQMVKAQALTYRAYAHYMLTWFYDKPYVGNEDTPAVPLMTTVTQTPQPFATMRQVYQQVVQDLEDAITLFEQSKFRREYKFDLDANVAKGIRARVAMSMEDWPTAARMAREAREGYPLMSNIQYFEGFNDLKNPEWIWGSANVESQNLHYYSYFAYTAVNSSSSNVRTGPKQISKPLYDRIPATDVRRGLWLYEPSQPNAVGQMNATKYPDLVQHYKDEFGTQPNAQIWYYMNRKFIAKDMPGIGDLVHMRSAEMYLIEAEACARMTPPRYAEAQQALYDVVSPRDPAYVKSSSTGQALVDEIWLYRRIELWGEGFRWYDLKRNRLPLHRLGMSEGGNYVDAVAYDIASDDERWQVVIPKKEKDANPNVPAGM